MKNQAIIFVSFIKGMNLKALITILCLLTGARGQAQCRLAANYNAGGEIYHTDTTLCEFYADTTSYTYSAHTSFAWRFSDGTTQFGKTVLHKFTQANAVIPTLTYTLTVVDTTAACTGNDIGTIDYPSVFNCRYLGDSLRYANNNSPRCNELVLDLRASSILNDFSRNPFLLITETTWGDGVRTLDTSNGLGFPEPKNHIYHYQGVYKVQSIYTAVNQFTGARCPSVSTPLSAQFVLGRFTVPIINGRTTVCEGDTLRLIARDTTPGFYNMAGTTDMTGIIGPIDTSRSNTYEYHWEYNFDSTGTTFWGPVGDTAVMIPSATLRDTLFMFQRSDISSICGSLLYQKWVHVTIVPRSLCALTLSHIDNKTTAVYPNPTNGQFMIAMPAGAAIVHITIRDITGRIIDEIHPQNIQEDKVLIQLQDITVGTYLLEVNIDGNVYHDRIVVTR